jgi:hypothetical protein
MPSPPCGRRRPTRGGRGSTSPVQAVPAAWAQRWPYSRSSTGYRPTER